MISPRLNRCKLWGSRIHKRAGGLEVAVPSPILQDSPLCKVVTLPFVHGTGHALFGGLLNWPGDYRFSETTFRRGAQKLDKSVFPSGSSWGTLNAKPHPSLLP
uniref:Uncharacterized protein n=1 Tax=Eutreptiella gymnastica TaxID=73025 RepID=A0A7S1IGI3_9EUGL